MIREQHDDKVKMKTLNKRIHEWEMKTTAEVQDLR
jgi:hypothetical protein